METIVYFIRHSEPLKLNNINNNDSIHLQNEKKVLSINGERLAEQLSNNAELQNIDVIYSSNYVRAISTAKYIAEKNNLEIIINSDFGERKFGINSWDEYPTDFELRQFEDEDYKINNGESQKDVRKRMNKELLKVLNDNKGKRIAILCHATAMMYLFKTWCNVKLKGSYSFNNNVFFDGRWNYCETFKLIFDEANNLISIENIKTNND